MPQPQRLGGHDRRRRAGVAPPGEDVENDVGRVDALLQRLGAGGFSARRIVSCAEASQSRDGRWIETAGIVLVRQMPGSAKGVLFVTLEDETGVANLVIWPKLYERQRRVVPR